MIKRRGQILLELIVSIMIISIIMINLSMILNISKIYFNKFYVTKEIFYNGRIGVEFISRQFETFNNFEIIIDNNNILKEIVIFKDSNRKYEKANVIVFVGKGVSKLEQTISFGGKDIYLKNTVNRLADNIKKVEVVDKENIIILTIETLSNIENIYEIKEMRFRLVVEKRGKNIVIKKVN